MIGDRRPSLTGQERERLQMRIPYMEQATKLGIARLTPVVMRAIDQAPQNPKTSQSISYNSLGSFINLRLLENFTFARLVPWCNTDGYLAQLFQLTSAPVWENIAGMLGEIHAVVSMRQSFSPENIATNAQLGVRLEQSNAEFATAAVGTVGLVALLGSTILDYQGNAFNIDPAASAARKFADDPGFSKPADSVEELMRRLLLVFPGSPEESENNPGSAYRILRDTGAFKSRRKRETCPGQELTKILFASFGTALRDRDFQQRFTNRLQK